MDHNKDIRQNSHRSGVPPRRSLKVDGFEFVGFVAGKIKEE